MDEKFSTRTRGTVNNVPAIIDTIERKYQIIPERAEAQQVVTGDWVFSNGPTPEWRDLKETDEVTIHRFS